MEQSYHFNKREDHKLRNLISRSSGLLHSIVVTLFVYRRASYLGKGTVTHFIPYILVFVSEIFLAFEWLLRQASRCHFVSRVALPDNLPVQPHMLPGLDVFICTADPEKEPTLEVMNTVLSAMAMDYPPEKLNVYLSDDSGAFVTLRGMRLAWKFAKIWVPFCNKYRLRTRCPGAFFSGSNDEIDDSITFLEDKKLIQEKYRAWKEEITLGNAEVGMTEASPTSKMDHGATIEVIGQKISDGGEEEGSKIPRLVYVSREKRPSSFHNFKAGALNVLLRVSGVISNSPFVLVLDCDHQCNDSSSAKQAMCFHLDPDMSSSLAFVQFPQSFHSVSKKDIYDSQLRFAFKGWLHCMDGLEGPCICGSNFFIKRISLYSPSPFQGIDFAEARSCFGQSNEFLRSLRPSSSTASPSNLIQETKLLASCFYEDGTQWGRKVGFLYNSVLEDFFTSLNLHCRGWKSVYLNPPMPQFLGSCVTNLNDLLIQQTRWSAGLVQVGLSRFSPLIYGPPRMSLLQSISYGHMSLLPVLNCVPLLLMATIPQICLLNNVSLYPPVRSPDFALYSLVLISAASMQLRDILNSGGSLQVMINETRIWMWESVTSALFGSVDVILIMLKLRRASFTLTSKHTENDKVTRYQQGIFDFRAPATLLGPIVVLFALNLLTFILGIWRAIVLKTWDGMFAQIFLSFFILAMNYPVLDGVFFRKDDGRVPPIVSIASFAAAFAFLSIGSIFLM